MPNYWFDHVHLVSSDPLKTAEFYEKMFGAKRGDVRKLPDGRITMGLDLNGVRVLIMQTRTEQMAPGMAPTGLEHFGIGTDDIEAAVADLKAGGVKFVKDITESLPGVKISFLLTPENTLIELLERNS